MAGIERRQYVICRELLSILFFFVNNVSMCVFLMFLFVVEYEYEVLRKNGRIFYTY